jgi:hypothetical protein
VGVENDTLALISLVPSVRAVMDKYLDQPLNTDKQYALQLSDWNATLVHSVKAKSLPYNRTLPKGGTVIYLTPTGGARKYFYQDRCNFHASRPLTRRRFRWREIDAILRAG